MLSIINLTVAQNNIETFSSMKIKFQILKFVDIDQKLLKMQKTSVTTYE